MHVWDWFVDLDAARAANGFGVSAIGYAEIDAYARMSGIEMRGWEVRALRKMDSARLAAITSTDQPKVSSRPLSPALFDGLFSRR